jgi:hypothetical protein
MRIIAYDRFRPGVTMEQITPYLTEEVSNVWRLWKAGIVRENYARAESPELSSFSKCPTSRLQRLTQMTFLSVRPDCWNGVL